MNSTSNQRRTKRRQIYQYLRYYLIGRHIYGITSSFRVLPDFIIIGAKRCGTTSLYEHLGEHPSIIRAKRDNLGFFNNNFHLGLNYYRSFFPTIWQKNKKRAKENKFMTFDVTTSYFPSPRSAVNIHASMPKIKLILIVRNPADRAYSEYNLIKEENQTSFEKSVLDEIHRIQDEDSLMLQGKINYPSIDSNPLLRKSMYAQQLSSWLKLFSKDQILVISTEDFAVKTQETYDEIFNFLGLPHYDVKNNTKINKGSYVPMKPETRKLLIDYFEPHNKQFFEQNGKTFDWNK